MSQSDNFAIEEWRPVGGYEGWYEISSFGQVRRIKAAPGAVVGKILRQKIKGGQYYVVGLFRNSSGKTVYVHHLVAEAFHGCRPKEMEVNHKDANKLNNYPENLEYVTHLDNQRHARGLELIPFGTRKSQAKLNDCLVRFIKLNLRYERGCRLAKILKINRATIQNIDLGKTWKHVRL